MLNKKHPLYQEDLNNILSVKGLEGLEGKSILITGATGLIEEQHDPRRDRFPESAELFRPYVPGTCDGRAGPAGGTGNRH